DQALGIVTFPFVLEAALRVEFFTVLFRCRKIVLGAIEGEDRHPMPKKEWIARPKAVCQINGISENIAKDGPRHFAAGMGRRAAVDGSGIRPKTATPCRLEEFTRFDVHTLALPAGSKRENESSQFRKGKLSVAGEILVGLSGSGINVFGDQVEERCNGAGKLA
ncbi:MAG: hypothetical protein ABFD63_11590, partial [Smithella sp.]